LIEFEKKINERLTHDGYYLDGMYQEFDKMFFWTYLFVCFWGKYVIKKKTRK